MRASRLPPGRRVRPRGRPRASRGRGGAPPRVRPRRLRRRRGVHVLRPPREAAADRARGRPRAAEPRRARDRRRGCTRHRRAAGRQCQQHERVRPGGLDAASSARDVRRADRLGGRRRRRLRDRRDLLVVGGGVDRARGDQGDRSPRGDHARDAPGAGDARRPGAGGGVPSARGRGRGRRRAQLHPRAADDDADAARGARGVQRLRGRASRSVPDD